MWQTCSKMTSGGLRSLTLTQYCFQLPYSRPHAHAAQCHRHTHLLIRTMLLGCASDWPHLPSWKPQHPAISKETKTVLLLFPCVNPLSFPDLLNLSEPTTVGFQTHLPAPCSVRSYNFHKIFSSPQRVKPQTSSKSQIRTPHGAQTCRGGKSSIQPHVGVYLAL